MSDFSDFARLSPNIRVHQNEVELHGSKPGFSLNVKPNSYYILFCTGQPVVITDVADKWPAANWTLDSLTERVGDNIAFIRQQTDQEAYKVRMLLG